MEQEQIPDGYWKDARGSLIPESKIRPMDRERDRLVRELYDEAFQASKHLNRLKARIFGDIAAFIELSAESYQTRIGGKKGNVTLYSFDGRYRIQRAIQERIAFDERLLAAKALIDECLRDWTADARPEIQTIVAQAFATDKEGQINTARVLALRRYDIDDPRWLNAMRAIGEAVQVIGSKSYVRVYERVGDTEEYRAIPLDIASV